MFWVIQSIIINIVLFTLTYLIFEKAHPHVEITNNLFLIGFVISIIILFVSRFAYKYLLPKNYAKYKIWKNKIGDILSFQITIFPLFGLVMFVPTALRYVNQYKISTPVITLESQVISKRIEHKQSNTNYFTDFYTPQGTLKIYGNNLYQMLQIGDKVTLKIQKGRFNDYYALELKVNKNNHILSL